MTPAGQWIRQAAALPLWGGRVGLVTSRNGRRWVIPKGLIDPGQTAGEAALLEAWEEAGVTGVLRPEPVGSYLYEKFGRPHHVTVFLLTVHEVRDHWPERSFRQRVWLDPESALAKIDEVALRDVVAAGLGVVPVLAE